VWNRRLRRRPYSEEAPKQQTRRTAPMVVSEMDCKGSTDTESSEQRFAPRETDEGTFTANMSGFMFGLNFVVSFACVVYGLKILKCPT
jgi:hypothetical protein